jgi:hypothetical protein
MTCGTTTTVPNGSCGLTTCKGPVCPTTPPGGCSTNPGICGAGKCCNANVCGNCATTPPATTPPVGSLYYHAIIHNDPTNTCDREISGYFPILNPKTEQIIGYDYTKPTYRTLNSNLGWSIADTVYNNNVIVNGGTIPLRETGGSRWIRTSNQNLFTATLSNIPAGYRCSDGPLCGGYNYGAGYYDKGNTCPSDTQVTADVLYGDGIAEFYITKQAAIPTPPPVLDSWWQVQDGEVTTDGNITSKLPSGSMFNIASLLGGFHGVPIFGGSLNTGSGTISTLLWNANTLSSFTRIFNYSFFENLIPDDVVLNDVSKLATGVGATVYTDGYEWYKITGNHTINTDINLGSRKVILFVKSGNLNIDSKINLTDHSGFFAAFVNGSTIINPALTNTEPNPALEGLYLSDGPFTTGVGTALLHLRGSVVSFGPITLGRNLSNNATRAELFEYAPDQIMLFPEKLKFKKTKWTEVAP